jgi:hypothetical protein
VLEPNVRVSHHWTRLCSLRFGVYWWTILPAGLSLPATGVVTGCMAGYEQRHRRLTYQYNNANCSGLQGCATRLGWRSSL